MTRINLETTIRVLVEVAKNPHPRTALGDIAAHHSLTIDQVRSIINEHGWPDQAALAQAAERQDLDPIEEARALAKLKDQETLSDADLGERIGRSQPYVSGRLALLELSAEDQHAIRAGTMSITRGSQVGRHASGKQRRGAWGRTAGHLTADHPLAAAVEALCRQLGHHKHAPGRIGGIGCGSCWEACIRSDERTRLERRRRPESDQPQEASA